MVQKEIERRIKERRQKVIKKIAKRYAQVESPYLKVDISGKSPIIVVEFSFPSDSLGDTILQSKRKKRIREEVIEERLSKETKTEINRIRKDLTELLKALGGLSTPIGWIFPPSVFLDEENQKTFLTMVGGILNALNNKIRNMIRKDIEMNEDISPAVKESLLRSINTPRNVYVFSANLSPETVKDLLNETLADISSRISRNLQRYEDKINDVIDRVETLLKEMEANAGNPKKVEELRGQITSILGELRDNIAKNMRNTIESNSEELYLLKRIAGETGFPDIVKETEELMERLMQTASRIDSLHKALKNEYYRTLNRIQNERLEKYMGEGSD